MFAIVVAAVFGFAWMVFAIRLISGRPSSAAVNNGIFYLVVVGVIAAGNYQLGFIGQKVASDAAFTGSVSTFVIPNLVNLVPFALTGAWSAAIGTNVAAMAALKVFLYDRSPKISRIMWVPAVVNFAMFALRDPLIGVVFFVLTFAICREWRSSRGKVAEWGSVLAMLSLRPENTAIYLASKLASIGGRLRQHPLLVALLPLLLCAAVYGLTFIPHLLRLGQGQASLTDLPGLLQNFFVDRAARNSDSGSNILGGEIFYMPFWERYPIQVLSFFLLPLPWEISGVAEMLAFVDSLVFLGLLVVFWRKAPREAKQFFVVYVLAVSFFAANYGNMFRIRLPAYFIMTAGLLIAELRSKAARAQETAPESLAPGVPGSSTQTRR